MARLKIKVLAGASRHGIVGWVGDILKVKTSVAPEKGKANQKVIQLLAGALRVSPSEICIVKGHTTPNKELEVTTLDAAEIINRIAAIL